MAVSQGKAELPMAGGLLCKAVPKKLCVLPVYQGEHELEDGFNLKAGATNWQSWEGGR